MYKNIIIIFIFILGLFYVIDNKDIEPFINYNTCPDILIKKGQEFYLINSKLPNMKGDNPLKFKSLEDYIKYLKFQRNKGIVCPVLLLETSYNTQGREIYSIVKNFNKLNFISKNIHFNDYIHSNIIDANIDNDPDFNINQHYSFDPQNQYIGLDTPIDKLFHDNKNKYSANPMDTNWGGHKYTQSLIDRGDYKEDQVSIYIP